MLYLGAFGGQGIAELRHQICGVIRGTQAAYLSDPAFGNSIDRWKSRLPRINTGRFAGVEEERGGSMRVSGAATWRSGRG
jgi:hypothetical protein